MTPIVRRDDPKERFVLEQIYGDCLEGAGLSIPHGGFAVIDSGTDLRVGDLVHCGRISGAIPGCIKQVQAILPDGTVRVGTAYLDKNKDFSFDAGEIYGVVTEVYCKTWRKRVWWRKDPATLQEVKILPRFFEDVRRGIKNFEVRYNDRNYQVGQRLLLREYDDGAYTGRTLEREICYVLDDTTFCKEGFVVLGLKEKKNADQSVGER